MDGTSVPVVTHEIWDALKAVFLLLDIEHVQQFVPIQGVAMCMLACTVYCALADLIYISLAGKNGPARWFFVHAAANLVVVTTATPALIAWFAEPETSANYTKYNMPHEVFSWESAFDPYSHWPLIMVIVIHAYHIVTFEKVTPSDYFHHLVFVPVIAIYGGLLHPSGPLRNVLAFFISGLPGGLDYVLLVMQKHGYIERHTEKSINRYINLYIRQPGLLLAGFSIYLNWRSGNLNAATQPGLGALIVAFFCVWNGIYYMDMVVGNWYEVNLKMKLQEELKKPTTPVSSPRRSAAKVKAY
eukprot:Clim_evm76s225 gene=Clim_evmTU76s225